MSRGHSTIRVVLLCIVAFFAGRFLQLPGLPDGTGSGPTIHRARKALQDAQPDRSLGDRDPLMSDLPLAHNAQAILAARGTHPTDKPSLASLSPGFSSFEELLEASGMLADRPPVPSGVSGHSMYTMQPMQLLSWYPRAYIFPKFMDRERCEHVIKLAERRLAPSGLALKKGDSLASTREIRTSQGTFLSRSDDPAGVLPWIEDKIAVLTGIPAGHGEAFNILRYENMQHYDSHFDSFDEESYGKQSSQRIATVLVYLSDVEEGGETSFLFEGFNGTDRLRTVDYKKCNTGIKYKPRAGDALLFWNVHPDHSKDHHSLHGGCPVIEGTKWTMTKWIRDKCLGGRPGVPCVGSEIP